MKPRDLRKVMVRATKAVVERLSTSAGGSRPANGESVVASADHPDAPDRLPPRHVADARLLPDRGALASALPAGGTVAEVGVASGDYAATILAEASPAELHLIDVWDSERYGEAEMRRTTSRFRQQIDAGTVQVIRKPAVEALSEFPDETFDWLYVDTSHTLRQTRRELDVARRKVKPDGFIAGHDYCVGNPAEGLTYGVIPAVHAFCVEHGWRLAYLTLETSAYRSFALTRMPGR